MDPFLDWIPDQSLSSTFVIGDRGQVSRMTEGERKRHWIPDQSLSLTFVIEDRE